MSESVVTGIDRCPHCLKSLWAPPEGCVVNGLYFGPPFMSHLVLHAVIERGGEERYRCYLCRGEWPVPEAKRFYPREPEKEKRRMKFGTMDEAPHILPMRVEPGKEQTT
jgi:hypothetical protein